MYKSFLRQFQQGDIVNPNNPVWLPQPVVGALAPDWVNYQKEAEKSYLEQNPFKGNEYLKLYEPHRYKQLLDLYNKGKSDYVNKTVADKIYRANKRNPEESLLDWKKRFTSKELELLANSRYKQMLFDDTVFKRAFTPTQYALTAAPFTLGGPGSKVYQTANEKGYFADPSYDKLKEQGVLGIATAPLTLIEYPYNAAQGLINQYGNNDYNYTDADFYAGYTPPNNDNIFGKILKNPLTYAVPSLAVKPNPRLLAAVPKLNIKSILKPNPAFRNKNVTAVYDDLITRIQTEEGKNRFSNLIDMPRSFSDGFHDSFVKHMKDIKINKYRSDFGEYDGIVNNVFLNPKFNKSFNRIILRHELEHGVQKGLKPYSYFKPGLEHSNPTFKIDLSKFTSKIDNDLSNLKLKPFPNKVEGPRPINNLTKSQTLKKNPNLEFDKSRLDTPYKKHMWTEEGKVYFKHGSDGKEKSAFLSELQQYMLDKQYINHAYDKITPDLVKKVYKKYNNDNSGWSLRIFDIMKNDPKNFQLLSNNLNKILTLSPALSAGAYYGSEMFTNK